MYPNQPLETLTAFVLCFAAGVVSTLALTNYIKRLKQPNFASNNPLQD